MIGRRQARLMRRLMVLDSCLLSLATIPCHEAGLCRPSLLQNDNLVKMHLEMHTSQLAARLTCSPTLRMPLLPYHRKTQIGAIFFHAECDYLELGCSSLCI